MSRFSRRNVVIVCVLFFVAVLLAILLWPLCAERILASSLRRIYQEEDRALGSGIASLGIEGETSKTFQCAPMQTTHWQTKALCEDFSIYQYSSQPIPKKAKQDYPANAAKLDKLLRARGWVNDRPHDTVTTLVASNPYASQNGGKGGSVPFHKNVGAISCNLKVDFSGVTDPVSPGAINVNEFSCQQNISYMALHIKTGQYTGP